jgi:hypothetical protein
LGVYYIAIHTILREGRTKIFYHGAKRKSYRATRLANQTYDKLHLNKILNKIFFIICPQAPFKYNFTLGKF